jgi:hypothetical protein
VLIPPGRLHYGDPEKRAIWPILEAIEESMDVEDLQPEHRAVLAQIHEDLGLYVGVVPTRIPVDWLPEEQRPRPSGLASLLDPTHWRHEEDDKERRSKLPDGIEQFRGRLSWSTWRALWDAGLVQIADIEKRHQQGDLHFLRGVGPKRLQEIHAIVDAYRQAEPQVPRKQERC